MGVYHFVSRTKTRDEIATMYNILIIYSSKKGHSGKRRNQKYIQVHNYATVRGSSKVPVSNTQKHHPIRHGVGCISRGLHCLCEDSLCSNVNDIKLEQDTYQGKPCYCSRPPNSFEHGNDPSIRLFICMPYLYKCLFSDCIDHHSHLSLTSLLFKVSRRYFLTMHDIFLYNI